MLAVIFDMDGVLLDSEPVQMTAFNDILKQWNITIPLDEFKTFIGIRTIDNFVFIKNKYGLPISAEEAVRIKNRRYQELIAQLATPRPGVTRLLGELKAAHIPTAVASNSIREDVMLVLDALRLTPYFDVIVAGDEIENGKPHPEIYIKTRGHLAERAGIEDSDLCCVVVEDNPFGIAAACDAGMRVIAAPTEMTAHMDMSRAACRVQSMEEIDYSLCASLCSKDSPHV